VKGRIVILDNLPSIEGFMIKSKVERILEIFS
jgi:hypothetical protein